LSADVEVEDQEENTGEGGDGLIEGNAASTRTGTAYKFRAAKTRRRRKGEA
jgi:hypothetical protein